MNIIDLNGLSGAVRGKGVSARMIDSKFASKSVNIIIEAGGELPLHTTPADVIFYVVKGTGILEIGDEKKEVKEGMFIDSPANIPHGWYNESNDKLSVLVIKLF